MAEIFGASASVITVLDSIAKVLSYLEDVKNAPAEVHRLRQTIESTGFYTCMIKDQAASSHILLEKLAVPGGPIKQLQSCLDGLAKLLGQFQDRSRQRARIAWPFKKDEINSLLETIEKQKSLIQVAYGGELVALNEGIKQQLNTLNASVDESSRKIDSLILEQTLRLDVLQQEQRDRILSWLSPLNFASTQTDTVHRRHGDTGAWFLKEPGFQAWFDSVHGGLWCPGLPGAGKTVISSIVADHIKDYIKKRPPGQLGLAIVFFNYRDQHDQTAANIIGAICKQIFSSYCVLPHTLSQMYADHDNGQAKPSFDELTRLLDSEVSSCSRMYIIGDAFDESNAEDRHLLFDAFRNLSRSCNILLTSRELGLPMRPEVAWPRVPIKAHFDDVMIYVRDRLQSNGQFREYLERDLGLMQSIERTLRERVQGMFLMAELQISLLLDQDNLRGVKRALAALPTGYQGMFEATMNRIRSQASTRATRAEQVLAWVSLAKESLTLDQLRHALVVTDEIDGHDSSSTVFDPDALVSPAHLISICCGLVEISPTRDIIRLTHYTVKEYFDATQLFGNRHADLCKACLRYVAFADVRHHKVLQKKNYRKEPLLRGRHSSSLSRDFPFLVYAARYWKEHYRQGCQHMDSVGFKSDTMYNLQKLVLRLLRIPHVGKVLFLVNERAFDLLRLQKLLLGRYEMVAERMCCENIPALSVLACDGLTDLMVLALRQGSDVNKCDKFGRTPLLWALQTRQWSAATLLLDHDARVGLKLADGMVVNHLWATLERSGAPENFMRFLSERIRIRMVFFG